MKIRSDSYDRALGFSNMAFTFRNGKGRINGYRLPWISPFAVCFVVFILLPYFHIFYNTFLVIVKIEDYEVVEDATLIIITD